MKKPAQFYLLTACLLMGDLVYAQTVTKTTVSPISGTVCPGVNTYYEVSVPSGFGACEINWTAVNGQVVKDQNDQRKAFVKWNDTPGAKGKVTATFSDCGSGNEGNNGKTASLEELILSVKNQAWGSYNNSVNIDFCTPSQVTLVVPHIYSPSESLARGL